MQNWATSALLQLKRQPAYRYLSKQPVLKRLRRAVYPVQTPKFVKKVPDRTKESQEAIWDGISSKIDRLIKERPQDQLASILSELREVNISRADPNRFYRRRDDFSGFAKGFFSHRGTTIDDDLYYPAVSNGSYCLGHVSPIRYIMNQVRPETEAIVELGSGWSCNLFQTYVGLGRTRCAELDFLGAEYTDQGRQCAQKIAAFDENIRFSDHHIDYLDPDVSFLEGYKGHIIIFTHHSVEQIEQISERLFSDIAALDATVTLLHFEPVGWQRDAKLMEARKADDAAYFHTLGRAFARSFKTERDQLHNAAWWSWRRRYNSNLTEIVDANEARGTLKVVRRAYDFGGIGNVLNPTTLYHLDFVKPSDSGSRTT